jgi:hypothetical protein
MTEWRSGYRRVVNRRRHICSQCRNHYDVGVSMWVWRSFRMCLRCWNK